MVGDLPKMFFVFVKTLVWEYFEERRVRGQFYQNHSFKKADQHLKKIYKFQSPFRVSKKFLIRKGVEDVHCYGETPLTTLNLIAQKVNLTGADHILELGCGRGRSLFFLASMYGCRVSGVEWIPEFVLNSLSVARGCRDLSLSFYLANMAEFPLDGPSIIYLYGTCLSEDLILSLGAKMSRLPPHVKIITVSYPLSDYHPDSFAIIDQFSVQFNWGQADVFIQNSTASMC